MRLPLLKRSLFAVGTAAAVALAVPAFAEDEKVVARVGETETVSQEEFDKALQMVHQRQMMQAQMQGESAPAELTADEKKQVLDSLVDNHVMYLLAKEGGFELSDAEVTEQIEKIKQSIPQGMTFEEALKSQDMTEAELRDIFSRNGAIRAFMEAKLQEVTVGEEDINAKYEEMKSSGELDTVNVAHVLVKVDEDTPEAWDAAKTKIDAAHKRVVDGEAFAEVAKEVSEDPGSKDKGGEYKDVPRGMMVPEFDSMAFETEVGKVSEPFKTQFGWHFLTVNAKGEVSKEEAVDRIEQGLLAEKKAEFVEKLAAEGRAKTKVEILVDDFAAAGAAAGAEAGAEEGADAAKEEQPI